MAQPSYASVTRGKTDTPAAQSYNMPQLPGDVWDMIVCFVPPSNLGRLACASKSLNAKVNHQNHWRQRIVRLGLLPLFEQHTSRRFFTNHATGVRDWKEYYISFYLLERYPFREPPQLSPAELCDEASLEFQRIDEPRLVQQFPAGCDGKLVRATATNPWFASWDLRCRNDGEEEGIWLRYGTTYTYRYQKRPPRHSHDYEYYDAEYYYFEASSLRECKIKLLLASSSGGSFCRTCPLPVSYQDWAHCLLDVIDIVRSKSPAPLAKNFSSAFTAYSQAVLALRHHRSIYVVLNGRAVLFNVRSGLVAPLLAEINKAFAAELVNCVPIEGQHMKLQTDPFMTFGEQYTNNLRDGDVWFATAVPDKAPRQREARRGRAQPQGNRRDQRGAAQRGGGRGARAQRGGARGGGDRGSGQRGRGQRGGDRTRGGSRGGRGSN